jgi:hypothetical protein
MLHPAVSAHISSQLGAKEQIAAIMGCQFGPKLPGPTWLTPASTRAYEFREDLGWHLNAAQHAKTFLALFLLFQQLALARHVAAIAYKM